MENHIAALRKQRRLSQEELAQAVGVSRQTITSSCDSLRCLRKAAR